MTICERKFPNSDINQVKYLLNENNEEHGIYRSYYLNGQPWSEITMQNNKMIGIYKKYRFCGCIEVIKINKSDNSHFFLEHGISLKFEY